MYGVARPCDPQSMALVVFNAMAVGNTPANHNT